MFVRIVVGVLILLLAAGAWVRLAPLPQGRMTEKPGPSEAGAYPSIAGVKLVMPLADLPDAAFDKILAIAGNTPRTERIGTANDPAAFVTRSKLWAFPDIATIWVEGDALHIYSHSVYGKGDMGVNAAKVARWVEALQAQG